MNKFRTITMYFVLVLVTLVLLFGINRIENRLDSQVAEHNLRFTGQIKPLMSKCPSPVTLAQVLSGGDEIFRDCHHGCQS